MPPNALRLRYKTDKMYDLVNQCINTNPNKKDVTVYCILSERDQLLKKSKLYNRKKDVHIHIRSPMT